jgi:hypothetical protein
MAATIPIEWRWPARLAGAILAAAILLRIFPPFHIHPLANSDSGPVMVSSTAAMRGVAEQFWNKKLVTPAVQPTDVRTLLAALHANPTTAGQQYGHTAELGGHPFYFVSGEGHVASVDHTGVWLAVDAGTPAKVVLLTGPIFGNALRDATGLLDIRYFSFSAFNSLSEELNRLAETRGESTLGSHVEPGSSLDFVAAGEVDDRGGTVTLELVPIRVTPK